MKILATTIVLASLAVAASAQVVIAEWTFENVTTPSTGSGTFSLIGGVNPQGTGFVAGNPGQAYNTTGYPTQGTNNGTAGVRFDVSTEGFQLTTISWDQRNSLTAGRALQFQYTTNGGATWRTEGIPNNAVFINPPDTNFATRTVDLSSIPGVHNNPSFGFRLVQVFEGAGYVATGTTSNYGTGGTQRFDNVRFEGELISDSALFFQSDDLLRSAAWTLTGGRVTDSKLTGAFPSSNWSIVGFLDLDGDGSRDLVWHDGDLGRVIVWLLDEELNLLSTFDLASGVEGSWTVKGIGNLNNSGNPGLIWFNEVTRAIFHWYLDGNLAVQSTQLVGFAPAGWEIAAVADMNGNSILDLCWQGDASNSYRIAIWYKNDLGNVTATALAGSSGTDWTLRAATNLINNVPALVFQNNTTGAIHAWHLNTTGTVLSNQSLGNAGGFNLVLGSRR